jgi:protein SCO1/2
MIMAALVAMALLQNADSIIQKIGIDPHPGAPINLNLTFRDENGAPVKLAQFFGSRPVILTPVYYDCPMLCSMQLNGLVRAMKVMPFSVGKEFEIVTFSFDPAETPGLARQKKQRYIEDYGRTSSDAGWHFLTADEVTIRKLTDAIGFRYTYDPATQQWAHVSAILILTPAGKVSQYLNGIEHDPQELKYSLIQASGEKIGSVIDKVLLFCYEYNPHTGRYSLTIMRVIRLAGVATMLGLAAFMLAARWVRSRPGQAESDLSTGWVSRN